MSIIMVDCSNCYQRAKRFAEMSALLRSYADEIGSENEELSSGLAKYSEEFNSLSEDITKATDVWTYFYDHNVRTD